MQNCVANGLSSTKEAYSQLMSTNFGWKTIYFSNWYSQHRSLISLYNNRHLEIGFYCSDTLSRQNSLVGISMKPEQYSIGHFELKNFGGARCKKLFLGVKNNFFETWPKILIQKGFANTLSIYHQKFILIKVRIFD